MQKKVWEWVKRHEDKLTYLFFGVLTTAVSYVSYFLFSEALCYTAALSNLLAWVIAVMFAFVTNKPFVFKSRDWSYRVAFPEFVKFVSGRIGSGALETAFLFITVDKLFLNEPAMKLIASFFVMVMNYFFSKLLVFKKNK